MQEQTCVSIDHLYQQYGKKEVLCDLNLHIPTGRIVGLLGPNGSGKSTLLKILSGLITDYSGSVKIFDTPVGPNTKKFVSLLPDKTYFSGKVKPREAISIFQTFFDDFDAVKAHDMLRAFAIDEDQPFGSMSKGMQEKVQLVLVMSRKAKLYILDEPTTGLHFEDIRILLAVLRKLVDKGNTVLIIEHNPDVIRACDYLIDLGPEGGREGGQIVAVGTPDELRHNPKSLTGKYL